MGHLLTRMQIRHLVAKHGLEILTHEHMQIERACYQHGSVTTFSHSIRVACLAVWMADRSHLWYRVDLHSLIRAALLHDYFLYDWHDWDDGRHCLHGFTHGHAALRNALKDFTLNDIERDSIAKHMFPMTPVPPRYLEGYLVTLADKCAATMETCSMDRFRKKTRSGFPPITVNGDDSRERPTLTQRVKRYAEALGLIRASSRPAARAAKALR